MAEAISSSRLAAASGRLIRKLGGLYGVSAQLEEEIAALCRDELAFQPRQAIIRDGEPYSALLLIERGWVLRSKCLGNGRRQIVNVALPGDFLCVNATIFGTSDFDLTAKTAVTAFRLQRIDFATLLESHHSLALALAWSGAHEESLLAERITTLGRRDSRERLAHALCELAARTRILGLNNGDAIAVPLTQEDFADTLGISTIHVNRTLRSLARQGLITYAAREVRILEPDELASVAGFDGNYLHFTERRDRL